MDDLYPSGPQAVPVELTNPTKAYKQRAWVALASLVFFMTIYLTLAMWFVATAYRMFDSFLSGATEGVLHLFIAICSGFLAIFMLKALFFLQKGGVPDAVEVNATEQPRLFEFLYRLADEAGAPRPHRLYLSARVNAAVFYDLSILNLLFPARKNLEIGLALVNVLTLSEMKAVLAHEFGHFAQRSMAIGSWVYIAQQIASHVIARRDALDKLLRMISNTDFRVAWIGWLLSLVVWSIRSLMDTLLSMVVLAQRALSRQMEFQADLVAVSLTGSDELVYALHKLQAADEAWARTLDFTNAELRQDRAPHDVFAVQSRIIEKMARILDDDSYGQVPRVTTEPPASRRVFKTSFAHPPQMWSTHPASADRENNVKQVYISAPHDARSAWLLFDDVESTKAKVASHLLREVKADLATEEHTFTVLDERYALRQLNPRYRGAYLGRALTRHAVDPSELYGRTLLGKDVQQALSALYSPQLAADLTQLRELEEELITLQALRDNAYKATGGRIVFRGREISRRELPDAIRDVATEVGEVRDNIVAHDLACRSAHLSAAAQIGGGWYEFMTGLIETLHYAEHTLADVRDAQGVLANVFAVVTADGKVSSRELKRLIAAANMLHEVLASVHEKKTSIQLDQALLTRLAVSSWAELLEEFSLPPASADNINDWIRVIDGWVDATANAFSNLYACTLEELLHSEETVAQHLHDKRALDAAPAPSKIPPQYSRLLAGKERKRQQRLGLWDRFQTADGLWAGLARFLAAGTIVVAVLGFGSVTGTTATLSIYNGLGREVRISTDHKRLTLAPFTATQVEIDLKENTTIETRTSNDELIESFTLELGPHAQHYVYNVAAASPLVEWTAVYGNASEQAPHYLGARRWLTSAADVFFAEPPQSVKTKGGGATRVILTGFGDLPPSEVLKLIENAEERRRIILTHAKWDTVPLSHVSQWQALAKE